MTENTPKNTIPSILQEEINDTQNINLTQKIIEQEKGNILFLSLDKLTQSVALSGLKNLLEQELLEKLRLFIVPA